MKFDELGCLVREKYDPNGPDWMANLGDSAAETCRYSILSGNDIDDRRFMVEGGYVRHPALRDVAGWNSKDFTCDQLMPLFMVLRLRNLAMGNQFTWHADDNLFFIHGTRKLLSIGAWALMRREWWLLNLANIIQGWIFNLSWRIADGGKIERSEGQVQDWLNYVCTYIFLKRIVKWATLNQSPERCMKAIRKYYLEGDDWEPNAEWIVELYERNLR